MESVVFVHRKAAELGKLAVRMTTMAGAGHPSSALSLAHLVTHLIYRQMRWDPADPLNPAADRLVLSEGHAVPIVYAAYADLGGLIGCSHAGGECDHKLAVADLDGLRARDSVLDGHPNPAEGVPFFDAATGSLGMGLSVAAGLALAARRDGLDRRIYALIGDGESREGQIWEAADFVVDHKLTSVCAVFNCNGQGQAGYVSSQQSDERLAAKLEAFGWKTTVINGHDPVEIAGAFARVGESERPLAIIARTVKGWGVEALLSGNWHGKPLPESELEAANKSLDAAVAKFVGHGETKEGLNSPRGKVARKGFDDDTAIDREMHEKHENVKRGELHTTDLQKMAVADLHEVAKNEGLEDYVGLSKQDVIYNILKARISQNGLLSGEGVLEIPTIPVQPPKPAGNRARVTRLDPREVQWPSFNDAMESTGLGGALKKNALATRRAYGAALKIAGDLLPQVTALDGDVSNSTFSEMFAKAHPDRFYECKIAEQNMISAAVGLAATGHIPFANSFAKFIARAYDQVELANISRANVKIVGSHAGVTPCSDGPSQMALVDVAFFHALSTVRSDDRKNPLCWVFQPSDAVAAFHLTRLMVELRGMCYMRTFRPDVPLLYAPETRFEPGGLHVLSPGDDLALVAAGYMVHMARQAAGMLAKQNIRAAVVDCYTLPINPELLVDALRSSGKRALVVEDNYGGGLGSAVAQIAGRSAGLRVESLICQRIPKSTRTPEEELDYCGVGPSQIADHAKAMLGT